MDATEKKTKVKSREYPAVILAAAIAFIEKLKDYPLNKPISYETAAGVWCENYNKFIQIYTECS